MDIISAKEGIDRIKQSMEDYGYGTGRIQQFNSTANQLLKFMEANSIHEYNMEVGIRFIGQQYGFKPDGTLSRTNQMRMQDLTMLSELQLHGAFVLRRRNRNYDIPVAFKPAAEAFLAYRRFCGIIEKNMCAVSLYLERFFSYLTAQGVEDIRTISGVHVQGFLRYISGFSNQSKDHMMRTVRQFLEFCYRNGYHSFDLTPYAPGVHFEKRARIPTTYTAKEVDKVLEQIDRANPIGKRDYAIILLVARLGLRSGDVSRLCFDNVDWEHNRISLVQHKTGKPLTLPLLEDVGLAIIDYLRFGRPQSDSTMIFLRHRPPYTEFTPGAIYSLVSRYIHKAGLYVEGKKRGPHALRHSLASRLLEEKVPLPVISEILGHTNTETTATYLSISIDQLRHCALEV